MTFGSEDRRRLSDRTVLCEGVNPRGIVWELRPETPLSLPRPGAL